MTRLPLSLLLIAVTTLPVIATEFVVHEEVPGEQMPDDMTVHSLEAGADLSLGECCCDCCPSWTGRVGYVFMQRERIGSDFAVWESGIGAPLYTADQFDFDGASGVDAELAWDNGCGQGLAVRYLGLEDHEASDVITFAGTTFPATNPLQGISWVGGETVDFRYESELHSVAAEYQRCCGEMLLTWGFRYVNLDETFSAQAIGIATDFARFRAKNDLYGLEVGIDGLVWEHCSGLRVGGLARAGLYYNDSQADSFYQLTGGGATTGSGRDRDDRTAFVGELGLTASYDVSCCLSLLAGYQLFFMDGVALAADQVPNTGSLTAGANNTPVTVDSSSLLYHGLNIGLEYRR